MRSKQTPIDCAEAHEHLYEYLDGELTPETAVKIREHLKACAKCFANFNLEKSYLRFLEARGKTEGAPPELKQRILADILEAGRES